MNHFDDFCSFVNGMDWMSQTVKDQLIRKMSAAMKDAYDRGRSDEAGTNLTAPLALPPAAPDPGQVGVVLPPASCDPAFSLKDDAREDIDTFAARLSDAFSTKYYRNGWGASIFRLRQAGYSDREIEAIIRSKWPRWAASASRKPMGKVAAKDLIAWMDANPIEVRNLPQIVFDTFGASQSSGSANDKAIIG